MNHDSGPSGIRTTQDSIDLDWQDRDQNPARCVIDAIAVLTGVPATGQQPLYESIDPDAFNRILESAAETPCEGSPVSVSFCHQGCEVVITAGGELTVTLQEVD